MIELLNRYLSEMSDAILDHGGTLVSYMGDGIMAVFGAPIEQADHADRAVAAAREMRDVRLPSFNEWCAERVPGEAFRMGIGVASGPVMSGNVGSERRLEYAAVGDTTNIASRLQGLTKEVPQMILLADTTRAALTRTVPDLAAVGALDVRGREVPAAVWTLGEPGGLCRERDTGASRTERRAGMTARTLEPWSFPPLARSTPWPASPPHRAPPAGSSPPSP